MPSTHLIVFLATLSFASSTFYPNFPRTNVLPRDRSDAGSYRLPPNVLPIHYRVTLMVDPDKIDSFSGEVEINVSAQNATNQIVLHSNVVKINNVSVIETGNMTELYESFSSSEDDKNFLIIILKKTMVINQKYLVYIKYTGKYGSYFDGLYLSSYKNDEGKTKYVFADI